MPSVGRIKQLSVVGPCSRVPGRGGKLRFRRRCLALGLSRPEAIALPETRARGRQRDVRRRRSASQQFRGRPAHLRCGERIVASCTSPRRGARPFKRSKLYRHDVGSRRRPALRRSRTSTGVVLESRVAGEHAVQRRRRLPLTPTDLGDYVRFESANASQGGCSDVRRERQRLGRRPEGLDDSTPRAFAVGGTRSPITGTLPLHIAGHRRRLRPRSATAQLDGAPSSPARFAGGEDCRDSDRGRRPSTCRSAPIARTGSSARSGRSATNGGVARRRLHARRSRVADWAGKVRPRAPSRSTVAEHARPVAARRQTLSIGTSGITTQANAEPTPAAPAAWAARSARQLPLAAPVGSPGPEAAARLAAASRCCRRASATASTAA